MVKLTNSWSTRELQLAPLMEIVENSLTVLQLAELDLKRPTRRGRLSRHASGCTSTASMRRRLMSLSRTGSSAPPGSSRTAGQSSGRRIEHLPVEQRARVDEIFNQRVRTNTQVTRLECLMLHDRLRLLGKCDRVVSELGFASGRQYKSWKERLVNLRDNLAHGGGLLHAESDPVNAIQLLEDVRSFAERIWELA